MLQNYEIYQKEYEQLKLKIKFKLACLQELHKFNNSFNKSDIIIKLDQPGDFLMTHFITEIIKGMNYWELNNIEYFGMNNSYVRIYIQVKK